MSDDMVFSASVRSPSVSHACHLALQAVRASAEKWCGVPVFIDGVRYRTTEEEWDRVQCVAVVVELTAIAHPIKEGTA